MSDSPNERENLTAALVRDYDDEQLVEWIHALQDREEELEAEVERLTAEVERLRDKLTEICDMDWLDSALDNRWPSRIARTALAGEGDEDGE